MTYSTIIKLTWQYGYNRNILQRDDSHPWTSNWTFIFGHVAWVFEDTIWLSKGQLACIASLVKLAHSNNTI